MDKDLEAYIKRVDPEIFEAMSEFDNFEETAAAIRGDADEILQKLHIDRPPGDTSLNFEMVAYLFAMQNRAINQMIEEIEDLRPSIRFITSVLLGNQEAEADDNA